MRGKKKRKEGTFFVRFIRSTSLELRPFRRLGRAILTERKKKKNPTTTTTIESCARLGSIWMEYESFITYGSFDMHGKLVDWEEKRRGN